MSISVKQVTEVFAELKPYCHLAKDYDIMSVTEWSNGEGFDVSIETESNPQQFQMTYGELTLLNILVNYQEKT